MIKKETIHNYISAVATILALILLSIGLYEYFDKHPQGISVQEVLLIFVGPILCVILAYYLQLLALQKAASEMKDAHEKMMEKVSEIEVRSHLANVEGEITQLLSQDDMVINSITSDLIKNFKRTVNDLKAGHFYEEVQGRFYEFAVKMFFYAENKVQATSIVSPEFWLCEKGISYLKKNKNLIKKNKIEITRYFIFKDGVPEYEKNNFKQILKMQIQAKIIAKVVDLKEAGLGNESYEDVGLIDDKIAIIDTYDNNKGMLKCDCYYRESEQKERVKTKFMALDTIAIDARNFLKTL